uniref:RING-type domain-containing protein n=1 Tax=Steinernema glaseri TaxID=37863 RepID=A0A1I7XYA6_9BILA
MTSATCFFHCSHRRYDAPFAVHRNYAVFISHFSKYLIAANLTTGQPCQLQIQESQKALLEPFPLFAMKQLYSLNNQLILVFAKCEGSSGTNSPSPTYTAFYVPIEIDTLSRTFRFLTEPVSTGLNLNSFKMLPGGIILKSLTEQHEVFSIPTALKNTFPSPPTTNPTPLIFMYNEKPHCFLHDFSAALVYQKEHWNRHDIQLDRVRAADMMKYASISLAMSPQGVVFIACSSPREASDECVWFTFDMMSFTLSPLKIDWSNHRLRQNCRITLANNFLFLSGRCGLARCSGEAHLYVMELKEDESPPETPPSSPESSRDMVFVTNNALACPVCFETFTEPKQLPCCGNTLCHHCEEHILRERKLLCPICRRTNYFRTENDRLPPNRALKEILGQLSVDEPSADDSRIQCHVCSEHINPEKTFYCETCDSASEQPLCGSCGLDHHLTNTSHVLTKTTFLSLEDRQEMLDELRCSTNLRPMITSCTSHAIHTLKSLQTSIESHRDQQALWEDEFLKDVFVTSAASSSTFGKIELLSKKIRKACSLIRHWDERTRQGLTVLEAEVSAIFNDEGTDGRQS